MRDEKQSSDGKSPEVAEPRPRRTVTLWTALRAFLAVNACAAFYGALGPLSQRGDFCSNFLAGPLWLTTGREFHPLHAFSAVVVVVLLAAMSSLIVWPSRWTFMAATLGAICWCAIANWVATLCAE